MNMLSLNLNLRVCESDAGMACDNRLLGVIVGSVERISLGVVVGMRGWSMLGVILRGRIRLVLGMRWRI
jgi:hypothetical protein